jgi:RNA-directed DNA polymerase
MLHLIEQRLKAPVIGEDANGVTKTVGGGKANRKGTPQGGVTSPLSANCYLHTLDRIRQRRHMKGKLQAHLVRYADDFVVMCRYARFPSADLYGCFGLYKVPTVAGWRSAHAMG